MRFGMIVALVLTGCMRASAKPAGEGNDAGKEKGHSAVSAMPVSESTPVKKKKLQIVFCFGQSNMVGLAEVGTAWYLTQPPYTPPREIVTQKTDHFDWQTFYWQGITYYDGPRKQELEELFQDRKYSRIQWRLRQRGELGPWMTDEWGPKPESGKSTMYGFLDAKAEKEGIYPRMRGILDSRENQFTMEDAYRYLGTREEQISGELKRIREIYLKGATEENFLAFDAAVKNAVEAGTLKLNIDGQEEDKAAEYRRLYAQLAEKHLGMPVAKRTYIKAHGHVTGPRSDTTNASNQRNAAGPLSVGYGGKINTIGPEYGVGIALERLVDAPILIVKCSWGNTSVADAWRAPSLDGVETPAEKATRDAHNRRMEAVYKGSGKEYSPNPPRKPLGKLRYSWNMTLPEVEKVLADPGKYHPGYDPEAGYELAGLVWFQGYSDKENPAYGELLAAMIKDFRGKVNAPSLPVVCGTLGMVAYDHVTFENPVNAGMLQVARMPEFTGTVDVVNTSPYYPLELDLVSQVIKGTRKDSAEHQTAQALYRRAASNKGFHYHGSAKCFLLMGDAMGRSLANLMADGEPFINQGAEK